ncbi:MAG: hypothetical protein LKJ13_06030 [Clostridia bacterium]|jgi:hypothetical protein|nr:hypothetical protein [Clostridia bacterium]MCI1958512.1 hypothetical protein [Clostridia bacterium]MCI2000784.1 hypothetical protein [Clostridia bacterium]MCI2015424.1 hypothetical protein [Clostridia bacterium]
MENNNTAASDRLLEEAQRISGKKESDKDILKRQINAFSSAMPFVDTETRKIIFLAVKMLEIREFQYEDAIISAANVKSSTEERQHGLIKAVCKCLNSQERRQFEMICALMQMNKNGFFNQGGAK